MNFYIYISLCLFGCFILATGILRGNHTWKNFRELQAKHSELELIQKDLAGKNSAIENEISLIKNQTSYAQKVLKDRYHKVTDDEEIIFFDDDEKN